jgi:pectin methylesterase-like acyl-CoA thioesterase
VTVTNASADVLVVAAGGGGDFLEIQAAIDAANEGDTILVKSGTYLSFLIVGKQLEVLADTNASVHVDGAVRVRSLEAGTGRSCSRA